VLEKQLERSRLGRTLERIASGRVTITDVERPTPLAFPLLVDRAREQVSSEKFLDRVRRLITPLERAAATGNGTTGGRVRFARGRGRGFR
jgi:ATP-dependent Lhr-like helicase